MTKYPEDKPPFKYQTCGYCGTYIIKPCDSGKKAMKCPHDMMPNKDLPIPEKDVLTVPASGGTKHDGGKPRMDLIPPELLFAVATILDFGANKYADRNWEQGMKWGRVFGACMRHLWAWWRGDKTDPETGYSHLWHAGCCIAFLIAYEERKTGEDDRYKGPTG